MPVLERPLYLTATIVNGVATVVFASRPYSRLITSVWVNSVVASSVTLTRGGTTGTIDSSTFANPNTFSNPFILPAGQSLFVVFGTAANPVSAAAAKISSFRD